METDTLNDMIERLARDAHSASRVLARADEAVKNRALLACADKIIDCRDEILAANHRDINSAEEMTAAMLDRLTINAGHVEAMAQGLREVVAFPDLVGQVSELKPRPSGIRIGRMRVPIGLIAVIYESRPNVTADAAGLCIKSGNAVILRGGSEAIHTNRVIAQCLTAGLEAAGLPKSVAQLVPVTSRAAVGALLGLSQYIDLIVPRGGRRLIERVLKESTIPVLKHLDGVSCVYRRRRRL